jgi:hypothetical protein
MSDHNPGHHGATLAHACAECGEFRKCKADCPEHMQLFTVYAANQELEDLISEAISDSLDMDWSPRDGAKAVLRAILKEYSK